MAKARRGEILIEPYKQLRFGLMFLALNLFFSTLIIIVFGYYMWDMYLALSEYFKLSQNESFISLSKFSKPAAIGVGLVILFIITTLFCSARYTHQIYGPMVSIRRFLDEIIAGQKPRPIKLRASDQFQDLAERLNGLAERMDKESSSLSLQQLYDFVDQILAGKKPDKLAFAKTDPLYSLADKLNRFMKS